MMEDKDPVPKQPQVNGNQEVTEVSLGISENGLDSSCSDADSSGSSFRLYLEPSSDELDSIDKPGPSDEGLAIKHGIAIQTDKPGPSVEGLAIKHGIAIQMDKPGPSDEELAVNHKPGPSDKELAVNHKPGPSDEELAVNHKPSPSDEGLEKRPRRTSSRTKEVSSNNPGPTLWTGRSRSSRPRKMYPCPVPGCKLTFDRSSRLEAHSYAHTGQRSFKCSSDGCTLSYTYKAHLVRHMKEVHEKIKKTTVKKPLCASCSAEERTKKGRVDKPKMVSKYIKEYCDSQTGSANACKCGKSFRYVLREKDPATAPTLCHKCGQSFVSARDFRRHERGHITYECNYIGCDNREFSFVEMRKHIASTHRGYICNDCGKRFPNKAILREHVALHLEVRQVFCCPHKDEGCDRKYFHRRNLCQHISTTHKKIRFICEICSTGFSSKQKLTYHKNHMHSLDSESNTKPKPEAKKKTKPATGPKVMKPSMVHKMLGVRVLAKDKEEGDPQ